MEKSPGFSDTIQRPRGDSYPKPRHAIQGFSYDGAVEGKQRIKITADSFGIHKKQLGFLRFGLLQEAVFINAKIHLYGIDLMDKGRADKGKGVNSMVDTYFSEIFSSDKLLFIPEKVSGVRMTPVKIYLHDNENKVVGFSAQNGEIRLKDKTILLAGHARARCEQRQINASKISLVPEGALVVASQEVIYRSGSVAWKGDQLTTDFSLRRIETGEDLEPGTR